MPRLFTNNPPEKKQQAFLLCCFLMFIIDFVSDISPRSFSGFSLEFQSTISLETPPRFPPWEVIQKFFQEFFQDFFYEFLQEYLRLFFNSSSKSSSEEPSSNSCKNTFKESFTFYRNASKMSPIIYQGIHSVICQGFLRKLLRVSLGIHSFFWKFLRLSVILWLIEVQK